MQRETAYELAGRKHGRHHPGGGIIKTREIRFTSSPAGQVQQAHRALTALRGVEVEAGRLPLRIVVHYNVLDFTLRELEEALVDAGFRLDRPLLLRFHHALIHFAEDTQVHTLRSPERLLKQSHKVYVNAYAAHLHGDHDDTPPELRVFR